MVNSYSKIVTQFKTTLPSHQIYILLVWAGDNLDHRVPVLARRDHCFFPPPTSFPLIALHEECITAFSTSARSTSSPVNGDDHDLSCTIFNGSWNNGQPVGSDTVRWCLMSRVLLSAGLSVSGLFGGWFSAVEKQWQATRKTYGTKRHPVRCLCSC